jgi:hypothetical protein
MANRRVQMEKHHRLPRSRGGRDSASNISILELKQHRAWHYLFGNMDAQEAARLLSDVYIDPDYYLVAIPRKRKKSTQKRKTRCMCTTCGAEVMKILPKTNKTQQSCSMRGFL